jgi:hypothetical protein
MPVVSYGRQPLIVSCVQVHIHTRINTSRSFRRLGRWYGDGCPGKVVFLVFQRDRQKTLFFLFFLIRYRSGLSLTLEKSEFHGIFSDPSPRELPHFLIKSLEF